MSNWIKCSDKLPDKEGTYLCWIKNEFTQGAQSVDFDPTQAPNVWSIAFYEVTHWQPLPDPPNEEGK